MRESPDQIREMTPRATDASSVTGLIRTIVGPDWLRTYGIAAGMAALLSFTAANNTGPLPLPARLLYWLVLMFGGTLIAQITGRLLDRFTNLGLWQTITAMMLMITPAISVFAWLVTAAVNRQPPQAANLPVYVPPVLVISLAMATLHVMVRREPVQSHAFAPDVKTEPGATFRERLPFKFRHADIHALEAEDHYLRVHTSTGDTLILMRLYDAIRELDGIEGSQTHRSWWVAKDAVTDIRRADGRVILALKGDFSAPVSRSYQKALKQDGWL
ncbi:MAG: LytTR family DNA-binding domain-containing protein [Asticcacaulis sp.]|uniref:LytTR family DNA-binding domain-containing protein n=1 Tax=Asticcacaulis sp. TaxID=1872648 RepID=UPI0039E548D0